MSKRGLASVLTALVLVATGCSGESSPEHPRTAPTRSHTPQPDPPWKPLQEADQVGGVPSAPPTSPSLPVAEELAEGRSRLEGERFAVVVALLVTDVRHGLGGAEVMEAVAAASLPDEVHQYLVEDIDGQQAVGTERGVDTRLETWIRSRATGSEKEPDRLDVEIAVNMVSERLDLHSWYRQRFDVAWEDGRWGLVGYADGSSGPDGSANLTAAERREFLPGPGWRRIPPA